MSLPLNLKYRPQTFGDMFQPHITTALRNAIKSNRLPTTIILTGWTGTGKTSLARIYAMALNCSSPTPEFEPCGKCESCKRIAQGSSMDVDEINASEKNGINDVRQIIEEKYNLAPSMGKYRIFILDEAHSMSNQAQNAFLKPLEEAPEHVKFIICTTEFDKIIETIQNRSHIWSFDRVSDSVISKNLEFICNEEGFKYDKRALDLIASVSDGSPRRSLTYLDQICSDEVNIESVEQILKLSPQGISLDILEAASSGNIPHLIDIVDALNSQGKNLGLVLKQISQDISKMINILVGNSEKYDEKYVLRVESIMESIPVKSRRRRVRSACKVVIELFEQINYRNIPKDLVLTNGFIDLSMALRSDAHQEV